MPEVTAAMSVDTYDGIDGREPHHSVEDLIAIIVASEMECDGNDGVRLPLDPTDNIDVLVHVADDVEFVLQSKANVLITVAAFDHYEDRMRNITERLDSICGRIKVLLPPDADRVQVTFVPLKEGHWVVG